MARADAGDRLVELVLDEQINRFLDPTEASAEQRFLLDCALQARVRALICGAMVAEAM